MNKNTNRLDDKNYFDQLNSLIDSFKPSTILVIGDAMLDIYHSGTVERISPEAPIPILKVEKETIGLGGAAVVAKNLTHLGCRVELCCLVGIDSNKNDLIKLLDKHQILKNMLFERHDFKTLVKQRFLAKNQQIMRADYENEFKLPSADAAAIAANITKQLANFDAIVISDYEKGLLHPIVIKQIIKTARQLKIPCICDPGRGANFKVYQGVTTIKPNRSETEKAVNFKINTVKDALKAAKIIKKITQADFLSISLDSWGILFFESDNNFKLFAARHKEIFDISGAGDMVTTIITAFLAIKTQPQQIIPLANQAAGIVVSKLGAVSVSLSEIKSSLMADYFKKIVNLDTLIALRKKYATAKWVMTNGYFDDISAAKIRFLKDMALLGDISIVAINSDRIIKKQKKDKKILIDQSQRAEIIATISTVDLIIIFDNEDATELIKKIKPTYIVKSNQHKTLLDSEIAAAKKVKAEIKFLTAY